MLTGPTLIYMNEHFDSMRVIMLLALKEAEVKFVEQADAGELLALAPQASVPCFMDRGLVCYGGPLDALIHERYPSPSLLAETPIQRAQLRMLTKEVRSWYSLDAEQLSAKLAELPAAYERSKYYFSANISIFDVALAPLLYWGLSEKLSCFDDKFFAAYAARVLSQPSFSVAKDLVL